MGQIVSRQVALGRVLLGRREHNVGQPVAVQIEHFEFNALVDECADTACKLNLVADESQQHAHRENACAVALCLRWQNDFGTQPKDAQIFKAKNKCACDIEAHV